MKRYVAAGLWLYAFWYVGSMTAAILSVPDLLGPTFGITAGLLVAIDPRRLIWARPTGSAPAPAASAA